MSSAPDRLGSTTPEDLAINATLAALRGVEPRDGLPQRVMARLASAPQETAVDRSRRWLRSLGGARLWTAGAAALVIIATSATFSTLHHPATVAAPSLSLPHPVAQPAGAAAGVAVGEHPLAQNAVRTARHRGVRRGARAVHGRVPLPHGTVAPTRPAVESPSPDPRP